MEHQWDIQRKAIIGLGENSFKKSYYPDLQKKISELESAYSNMLAVFNSMGDGVIIHNLNGDFLFINSIIQQTYFTNLVKTEDIRINFFELLDPKIDRKIIIEHWESAMNGIQEIFSCKLIPLASAKDIYVEISLNKSFWCDQQVLVGVVRDITQQKLYEEKIKSLNIELEERVNERTKELELLNKDLESFTYSISHDLRTPLRHIEGFVNILIKNIDNPEINIMDTYRKIKQSTKRMSAMITDLLTFAQLGRKALNKGRINLQVLVDEIIKEFKTEYNHYNIICEVQVLPYIIADKPLLRLALENLISNAFKYSSKREQICIKIGAYKQGNSTVIFIKDNGVGFNMEFTDRLFGVFQRLHSNQEFEGIGIGLANAKQIVKKHDGKIWANAEVDKGATFFISLPN